MAAVDGLAAAASNASRRCAWTVEGCDPSSGSRGMSRAANVRHARGATRSSAVAAAPATTTAILPRRDNLARGGAS
jgi:hypothetical protein